MQKLIFFLLFALIHQVAFNQLIKVAGVVVNEDGRLIEGARYSLQSRPTEKKFTRENGAYEIVYQQGSSDTILFQHVGYKEVLIPLDAAFEQKIKNNSIKLDITLADLFLNVVSVSPNAPDTVFGSDQFSVDDFEFLDNGYILLLTYDKRIDKGAVLRLLDTEQNEINRSYLPKDMIELTRDFRGNIHLISETAVTLVRIVDDKIRLYDESADNYYQFIAPVIDTVQDAFYFSNYSPKYPAFNYYEFNKTDSTYKTIINVEDEELMEFYRAEFKYVDVRTKLWAHNKELSTGVDKEIWVGASVFANSVYYNPLYAPLFKLSDQEIVVFDHYKNKMYAYQPLGEFVDSVSIDYHLHAKKTGWEQPLIQDKVTKRIYGLFFRNGYSFLSEVNLETGELKKAFRLHFKYVENIQLINGKVYYIYRPYESVQKKFIYSEKMR
jgi:hypothetical protein